MECGSCTLCCKLLETHDIPSQIEEYCHNCTPGVSCSIYSDRPAECRSYRCMWLQMGAVGDELRPDKCHIIFDKIAEDVISARLSKDSKLNKLVMGQLDAFVNEGFSILVFRGVSSKCFLSKGHTKDYVLERVNDYSKLHRRLN